MSSPNAVKHYPLHGTVEYFYATDVHLPTILRAAAWWLEKVGPDKAAGFYAYEELGGWAAKVWMDTA